MKYTKSYLTCLTLIIAFWGTVSTPLIAQNDMKSDHDLVVAAIEDYVLGLYEANPDRIERSVDTTLRKIGYSKRKEAYADNLTMTYEQLHQLSAPTCSFSMYSSMGTSSGFSSACSGCNMLIHSPPSGWVFSLLAGRWSVECFIFE